MIFSLRTALRDMDGVLVDPVLTANQYRCDASGLPADHGIRVSFDYLGSVATRDFTGDESGNISEVVTASPAVAALFSGIGSAVWNESDEGFTSGFRNLEVVAGDVIITVQTWP